jgi:dipeptidyl aminopeptidase/acylaminoacyl peptidase
MIRIVKYVAILVCSLLLWTANLTAQSPSAFTLEQILSAPFPADLTAAKKTNRIAWTLNQEGKRNVWVAEAPQFTARQITTYNTDDGQELSDLTLSEDGNIVLYTRGGEKNSTGQNPNPTSNPAGVEQSVWSVAWSGGEPKKIDAGHSPQISSKGMIAYLRDGQIWLAPTDGSAKPTQIVVRGQNHSHSWSPDGSRLAFVSGRGDHAFIGIYNVAEKTVTFLAPSVDSDSDPQWSLDGARIAFIRRPAQTRDTPQGYFIEPDRPHPWAVWIADAAATTTGNAREIWHSGTTPKDSFPYMADETGGGVLNWAANDRLVIASEQDGWQHLYSLSADGHAASQLLTPGNCEVEQWSFAAQRSVVLFNSNCDDIDRRHLWIADVATGNPRPLTRGHSIEWSPTALSDSATLAYIASDATHAPRVFHSTLGHGAAPQAIAPETQPHDFPSAQLVTPQQVIFKAADGLEIHGQLFLPNGAKSGDKRAALVFMHGGSMRQMLLGWHYMYYYANAYAMNQYLASRGYVVLSVNYRSGIGYGREFREAPGRAGRGASEYQDVVAAGKFLQSRAEVDPKRVGLWGGSYGGYLTALGLGRNSDIFAAGVDFHGVHDWPTDNWDGKNISPELTKLAHESSPVTAVDTWKSPVLFIHGDDDRNVYFTQTVDLVARLRAKGNVEIEQLIFPDEIHDFLLHHDWLAGYKATADFFDRKLKQQPVAKAAQPN